jgi:hypothetical protein
MIRLKAFFQINSKPVQVNGLLQEIDRTEPSRLRRSLPASV